ncbi:MAG: glycosyltransferase [Clostridium sp.]|uniref:glycosyltransferase n=1 Tax=Cetobacterium sp. TaxID=2071632 RepID=UPI003F365815
MKTKILFVIDSLHCAGAEKSLLTLLSLIDYSEYSVDLQLIGYGGELESLLPKEVNLLSPFQYIEYSDLPLKSFVLKSLKNLKFNYIYSRLGFSLKLRQKNYGNREKARLFWEFSKRSIQSPLKNYDIAVAYAQGVPTFYVADKVKAKKKFAWVNVSYELFGDEKKYQKSKYEKFNKIVTVSDSAEEIFRNVFPEFKSKITTIYDINNPETINKMAEIGESYKPQANLKLLTIGRLANQKGYDIALEAAKILKKSGLDFKWYVLGVGPLKDEIKKKIAEYDLKDRFILLGITSNPYGYIKNSDIYVQTSRFEGFGLAIAEARILNIPVVTTEFDAVYNQMVQGKNGIVTKMDGKSVANGILELVNNEELRKEIIRYLKSEKKGNLEEYEKFLKLIEE